MFAYILKRILLMIPTLFGVLLLTFVVIQFVPGGPVEQYLAEAKAGPAGGAGGGAEGGGLSYRGGQGVDSKRIDEIKALYGFDKPPAERFVQMLGQFARFDLGQPLFINALRAAVAHATAFGSAAWAGLCLGHVLLHVATRHKLDDDKGQQQHAKQRRNHQQQAFENVGKHG